MNLFVLDRDPEIAARMNCDKHVCKIILEAVQMMSEAHIACGFDYKFLYDAPTHRNNHVTKWVRETVGNYEWTALHGLVLCDEYTVRYGKIHRCQQLMEWLAENVPPIPFCGMTPFRRAVAEECYHDDPVLAYHMYYVKCKRYFAKWRLGNVPQWYVDRCALVDGPRVSR